MTDNPEQHAIELLQQISQQKQHALKSFYELFETRVYHYAFSRLNDPFDAADTLNEVMLEVWKYASRFEGRSKVSTWLLGITKHKVYDRLRKRGPSQKHDDIEDHSDHLTDNALPMERVLSAAQDADLIQRCLQGMNPVHREALHLAFFEDLPYQEIARIAQCPEGTVKTRVFHAKIALKNCLAKATADWELNV